MMKKNQKQMRGNNLIIRVHPKHNLTQAQKKVLSLKQEQKILLLLVIQRKEALKMMLSSKIEC